MKSKIRLRAIYALMVLLTAFTQARADETTIDTPGAHIYSGSAGTVVTAPGVSVNMPSGMPQSYTAPAVPVRAPVPPTASYVNAQLSGMDFSNQNLAGADFTNAVLDKANFAGAKLTGAVLVNATLTNVDFTQASLAGADLTNANLTGANLTNADFSKANLTNATVDHALAVHTNFSGAVLVNVNMGQMAHQPPARPAFVDAQAISSALRIDPAHPEVAHKIDLTINFDFNSDKLTPDGVKQVTQIAAALKDPSLAGSRIMVEGHTDNIGSDAYNKDLSYRRAMRVQSTLIDQYGIDPTRLSAQGFGKTRPVASNESELGRAMNRRVTLVNLGK